MSRLPSYVARLLSLSPLIVTGVVATLLWVVEFGLFMELPLAVLLLIYVFWIMPNYSIEIIEFKAHGYDGWPVFSLETLVAGRSQTGLIFSALVLAAAGAHLLLSYYGADTAAGLLLAALLLVLPASAALLAVTRQLFAALNPVRLLEAALGMGHGYLFCLAGTAAIVALYGLSQSRGGQLWYFPLIYAILLEAYLIGAVVYARRMVLGVNAPRSPEAQADRLRADTFAVRNGILTHAYGFAAHGNMAGALAHIDAYISADEDTVEARLWMLNEMTRWEDTDAALIFAKRVIEFCRRQGFAEEAERVRLLCEHLQTRA